MSEAMGITLLFSDFRSSDYRRKSNPYFCDIKHIKDDMERSMKMEFDIYKIGAEVTKDPGMSKEQSRQEVQYKMARKMLQILLRRGIVTEEEYEKIDALNRQSFSPQLVKVYV